MVAFIFWTGWVSVLAGIGFQVGPIAARLLPSAEPGMLVHVFGLMAAFIGIMLILSSRDLAKRAPLVMWEGVLRLGGFAVMFFYGVWGGGGGAMVASAVFDLAVGVTYLIGLPRHLRRSAVDLLLDR